MQKKQVKLPNSAYEIYHNFRYESIYPLMLSTFLINSDSQFENNRAVRMLRDWLDDYQTMNQIAKHKFNNYIHKILKNLYILFENEADVRICMAPFYHYFYNQWTELTELIASNLSKGKKYTLNFIWYLSFDFCEKLDAEKQYEFNVLLSEKFEYPLLEFNNPDEMTFKPLLQTVRMINIQKAKKEFVENVDAWCEKMLKCYDSCMAENIKIETLIEIIGCRSFLVMTEQSHFFWSEMVDIFFIRIEKKLPDIMLSNQVDIKLLDWMLVIINFEEIQKFLIKNKKRFLKTMISTMKQSPDPKNAFHYEKYYGLRKTLINLFYFKDEKESLREMEHILTQFNRKHLSVLKDNEENIMFFDSMCEEKLKIEKNNIIEIIRSLSSAPTRKNFPVHVLIILVRVLHAASEEEIAEEQLVSVIKALSECIGNKINDPRIFELKFEITKYFITLATKYKWVDQKSTHIMLNWCEEFERNNKLSIAESIVLLRIIIKKHSETVLTSFVHKLEPLVSDITFKMKYNKKFSNVPILVSFLMSLYNSISWNLSHKYVQEICSDNTEDLTFLYLLQSQIHTRKEHYGVKKAKLNENEIIQLKFMIEKKEMWKIPSRINVYLYCIELLFMKISKQEALFLLKEIDESILDLFKQMEEWCFYPHMIHLAARLFFKVGNYSELRKLKSFEYFKDQSFLILSTSFQKHTIILMTYMYCLLLNKAEDETGFFLGLNEDRFLNSLFQGCNEFIGKSPRFYQEECYIILMAMKAKYNAMISHNCNLVLMKEIQKNIVWWEEANRFVSFKLPVDEERNKLESFLVEEFREYYEETVRGYFREEIDVLVFGKKKENLKDSQAEEYIDEL